MQDRGDKIVNLARAMLRSDFSNDLIAANSSKSNELPIKAICVTALLAALGGSAVTSWANEAHRPLNRYEQVELQALVYYTAKQTSADEMAIKQQLEQELGVPTIENMTAQDFTRARDYLRSKIR